MYHSNQQSNACEESPLKVRERCVSRIAEEKYCRRAATTRKSRKSGRRKKLVEAPQKLESQKVAEKAFLAGESRS
eukprot:5841002-Pleurochrysis_carterae.AAC.1